ncbi:MAG TPA: AraC family transcriptional regulator [Vicinamibacterales bacterium]|nr:AraC family transcriptional regulator [Vicinamibacterales bacterium]
MDALSDVLRAVRLTGAVFFDIDASEPWVAETPPGESIVSRIFPDADHLIPYHVITRHGCWGGLVGEAPMQLSRGDVIVFPHGDAHVLSSAPGMRGEPDLTLYRQPTDGQLPFTMSMGAAAGDGARLVCGYLACDAGPFNPLLTALPPVIRVSDRAGGAIATFVSLAITESNAPRIGGEAILGRLSELMFVDVVRRYLETLPPERMSWLAALREPSVGRALTALHRSPARPWTLDLLAREVGLSRSTLAERFAEFVGQPPMQYLTNWRMQLAANLLMTGMDNVAMVAHRVGYESEAAFSRAFKRIVGVPPSSWRKHRSG